MESFTASQWIFFALFMGALLAITALLALAALPVMAAAAQTLARLHQRSSYDKCARQLIMLATGLGWILTLAYGGLIYWTMLEIEGGPAAALNHKDITITVRASADMLTWLALALGTLLISLHYTLWRTLRNYPALHQSIGLCGAILCYLALYGTVTVAASDAAVSMGEMRPLTLGEIFLPPENAEIWGILGYMPALSCAMAGALGALWLLVRRKHDDFGRDHYTQMLPWSTAWARNSWIVLWLMLGCFTAINIWHIHVNEAIRPQDILNAAIQLLLWLIPALLWTIVVRSAHPLRHTLTLLLAFVLALVLMAGIYTGILGV